MEEYTDNTSLLKMLIEQRKQTIQTINNIEQEIDDYYKERAYGRVTKEQTPKLMNARNNLRRMGITLRMQTEAILAFYRSSNKRIAEVEGMLYEPGEFFGCYHSYGSHSPNGRVQ